jgi:DNA-binding transcriptional ArsR family regulator
LRPQLLESHLVEGLAETFKVLGDATRVRILDVLSRRELCVGDIAQVLGLSESAVSHQLRLLRGSRLVRHRRSGQMMFYALDDHHVIRLFAQAYEHVQERKADIISGDRQAPVPVDPPVGVAAPLGVDAPVSISAPAPRLTGSES